MLWLDHGSNDMRRDCAYVPPINRLLTREYPNNEPEGVNE